MGKREKMLLNFEKQAQSYEQLTQPHMLFCIN